MAPNSLYALLHRECHRLFPDSAFADLFTDVGRRSVPPMIVAVVMVLQRRDDEGTFRIARAVATDRVISTVIPRLVTATRRAPAASTATRARSRSTPTASS